MDMVGNVWQWTDEYVDDHTRAAIVRGGPMVFLASEANRYANGHPARRLRHHGVSMRVIGTPAKPR
jgi:formylglycine-generating enzyme required for sulfatase activity